MNLHERSDQELLADIAALLGSHRELTAKLVGHLAEIEERRLHLMAGYSSMFDFCQKKLGMSEAEAFRRILAARLGRRFPVVYSLLASGGVNLSTLELLRPYLTDENYGELFAAVTGMGKREVQSFLADRFPDPSHANPSRDIAVVIERGLNLLLEHLERTRLGKTRRPRQVPNDRKGNPSGIATATRREVYERDGMRCTYVAEDGRRCEARAFLELDHAVAKALGGSNESKNLRVRCRAHNQLAAEQTFGRERIEWIRHFRQKKSTLPRAPAAPMDAMAPDPAPQDLLERQASATTLEKVRQALRGMGFRDAQVREAIATVVRMHAPNESLSLEQALREALLVATAA